MPRQSKADKLEAQILALFDQANIDQYIAGKGYPPASAEAQAVRDYAQRIREQIGHGATDSSFAVC